MKHLKKFERYGDKDDKLSKQAQIDVLEDLLKANPLSKDHDFYIFIGRNTFEEAKDGLYKKVLEIENMVKITPDANSIAAMSGVQLRAKFQPDSKLYHIWLPKELESEVSGKGSSRLERWVVDLIDKYKISGQGKDLINPNLNIGQELKNAVQRRKDLDTFNL